MVGSRLVVLGSEEVRCDILWECIYRRRSMLSMQWTIYIGIGMVVALVFTLLAPYFGDWYFPVSIVLALAGGWYTWRRLSGGSKSK